MQTLLLTNGWDLAVDGFGNIALATEPLAEAQDAASAIKTFQGEVYYDTSLGIPYWQYVLGKAPPLPLMKQYFNTAALTVPGVTSAVSYLASINNRVLSGQVQVTTAAGISAANFSQNIVQGG